MSYLDLIIAIPLAYGAVKGFRKGFVIEVASLASLILGVFIAIIVADIIGQIAVAIIDWDPNIVKIVAFIIAFALVVLVVHLLAKTIEKLIKIAGLNLFNRIAGLAAGFLKIAFFISVVLILLNNLSEKSGGKIISDERREESVLYSRLENFAHFVIPNKEFLKKYNLVSEEETECDLEE